MQIIKERGNKTRTKLLVNRNKHNYGEVLNKLTVTSDIKIILPKIQPNLTGSFVSNSNCNMQKK